MAASYNVQPTTVLFCVLVGRTLLVAAYAQRMMPTPEYLFVGNSNGDNRGVNNGNGRDGIYSRGGAVAVSDDNEATAMTAEEATETTATLKVVCIKILAYE